MNLSKFEYLTTEYVSSHNTCASKYLPMLRDYLKTHEASGEISNLSEASYETDLEYVLPDIIKQNVSSGTDGFFSFEFCGDVYYFAFYSRDLYLVDHLGNKSTIETSFSNAGQRIEIWFGFDMNSKEMIVSGGRYYMYGKYALDSFVQGEEDLFVINLKNTNKTIKDIPSEVSYMTNHVPFKNYNEYTDECYLPPIYIGNASYGIRGLAKNLVAFGNLISSNSVNEDFIVVNDQDYFIVNSSSTHGIYAMPVTISE